MGRNPHRSYVGRCVILFTFSDQTTFAEQCEISGGCCCFESHGGEVGMGG